MALVDKLRSISVGVDRARSKILVAELILFLALIGYVAYITLSAQQGLCVSQDGHPVRRVDIPSFVYVFTGIGAFIVGHVFAQLDSAILREPAERQVNVTIEDRPLAAAIIHLVVAGAFLVLMAVMIAEAYYLRIGTWPITYYARCSIQASPYLALLASAGLSFVAGRWFWVVEWRR